MLQDFGDVSVVITPLRIFCARSTRLLNKPALATRTRLDAELAFMQKHIVCIRKQCARRADVVGAGVFARGRFLPTALAFPLLAPFPFPLITGVRARDLEYKDHLTGNPFRPGL